VRRGEGANPPAPTDAYTPTRKQRELIDTRDRDCRWPYCPDPAGWADHDHVIPHAAGGQTTCTNLCCLCRHHHRLKTWGVSTILDRFSVDHAAAVAAVR
jgi:hypothetical protein